MNVKSQDECGNPTEDLNGIQREYSIVNEVNSEYQFWPTNVMYSFDNQDQKSNYDDNYGVISKRNDVDHIPACSHQEEDGKYPIRKLDDDDILNVESGTSVGRDYGGSGGGLISSLLS